MKRKSFLKGIRKNIQQNKKLIWEQRIHDGELKKLVD